MLQGGDRANVEHSCDLSSNLAYLALVYRYSSFYFLFTDLITSASLIRSNRTSNIQLDRDRCANLGYLV